MARRLGRIVRVGLMLAASPAWGCPVCDRETGRQVRAGLFDAEFGRNLAATLLPFGAFLGIAAAIHFGPAPRRRHEP